MVKFYAFNGLFIGPLLVNGIPMYRQLLLLLMPKVVNPRLKVVKPSLKVIISCMDLWLNHVFMCLKSRARLYLPCALCSDL